jgi:hypothetical protein
MIINFKSVTTRRLHRKEYLPVANLPLSIIHDYFLVASFISTGLTVSHFRPEFHSSRAVVVTIATGFFAGLASLEVPAECCLGTS